MRANRTPLRLLAATAVAGAVGIAAAAPATSAPPDHAADQAFEARGHVRELPAFVQKWEAERRRAAQQVAAGIARTHDAGTATLDSGDVVSFGTTEEAYILTVLAEFSDLPHGNLPPKTDPLDNSTYVPSSSEVGHYLDLLYGDGADGNPSMREVYLEMSSGRHLISGDVGHWLSGTDEVHWVPLPGTQADYGADSARGGAGSDDKNGPVYRIVRDAITPLEVTAETVITVGATNVTTYVSDVWDRYDCDVDGDYFEPDGYVDHFQVVHSGPGQEAGATSDAIWSHRWYANGSAYGTEGPTGLETMDDGADGFPAGACLLGGYPVGGTSDLWVGDYTIEPEDGGVGVFVHEYAHDWGIPDFYDTSGGGENGSGFWTLMSSGSWASSDPQAIGTNPVPMGAPEKEQLGWFAASGSGAGALQVVDATGSVDTTLTLGPATTATDLGVQAIRVDLPPNQQEVDVFAPARNDTGGYWYSGSGDDLDHEIVFTATGGTLTFSANYQIEKDWDYAYVDYQIGTGPWTSLKINGKSSRTDPNGTNLGNGITGSTNGRWSSARATLPAGTTAVRFRYVTDAAVAEKGFAVDDVAVNGTALEAVSDPNEFRHIPEGASTYTANFTHYYLVELREHVGQDINLCGVYNFSYGTNQVDKNCYGEGVLIWYVNTFYNDNNTSQHPGGGLALPVDLRPDALTTAAGTARSRLQVWDAPLTAAGLQSFTLGGNHTASWSAGPLPVFFDASMTSYWNPSLPTSSLRTAGSGVKVELVSKGENTAQVRISK